MRIFQSHPNDDAREDDITFDFEVKDSEQTYTVSIILHSTDKEIEFQYNANDVVTNNLKVSKIELYMWNDADYSSRDFVSIFSIDNDYHNIVFDYNIEGNKKYLFSPWVQTIDPGNGV